MHHEPLRYAHEEGHTDVCFSSDGSKFITCGVDGDVRIWFTNGNEDPVHSCVGDSALSVRQKGDNLYVATGGNDVKILTFPEGERNGVLDRSVAPVNQIAVSRDSEHVALAGEDMEIKLIDLGAKEKEVTVFDGLKGPCLSVALTSKYLASSSGDGKLRIWNIENKALVKEVDCFPKTNSFANAKCLCRIDFQPVQKNFLAYPDQDKVVVLNVVDWSECATLKCDKITAHYSLIEFSPCGNYLLTTSLEGDFVIFDINTKTVNCSTKHPNCIPICGLMWNPSGNGQFVYTDTEGQLGLVSNCIIEKQSTLAAEDGFEEHEVDFGDVQFEDDDDDDDENVISVEKLKKEVLGDSESNELNFDSRSSVAPTPRPKTPEIPLQPPFMPSSTPEHLNPRYLCWNEVGMIRSYGSSTDDDDSGKSIEVEFHDSTFHNSMMLQNYQDYCMGSVSKAALAVANSVQLCVIPLNAPSKEWVLKLDESPEEIVLIAASENMICFGTNSYIIRVCSVFGTQRGVIAIPGPLVSMAGFKNMLLVAYHYAGVRKGDQCINIKLITFNGFSMHSTEIGAALGSESTLAWLGFTDMGIPAMMNSSGMLSLYPKKCNCWIPFCDTAKHIKNPSDGFFVTAVLESCQSLMGVKCRGSVYPGFTPRPTVYELPLEPPFAEPTTEKTQLEMNLFTWTNLKVKDADKKFTEIGLKTFALACKNGLDQRAVEFVEILDNPAILSLATKYAAKMNKKMLAEKLMEMARKILNEEKESSDSFTSTTTPTREPPKKLTLSSIKKITKAKQITQEITQESIIQTSTNTIDSDISTQELIMPEESKNPFLRTAKENDKSNPLSLTNKFAGVDHPKENEKKMEVMEKRKRPDSSDVEKQREKQRKLDRFMFTKHS